MDYETGVRAAKEFADLVAQLPFEATPAQAASGVGGATSGRHDRNSWCQERAVQVKSNAAAGELPPLGQEFMDGVRELYDRELRAADP